MELLHTLNSEDKKALVEFIQNYTSFIKNPTQEISDPLGIKDLLDDLRNENSGFTIDIDKTDNFMKRLPGNSIIIIDPFN
jgi:hypothetical protein